MYFCVFSFYFNSCNLKIKLILSLKIKDMPVFIVWSMITVKRYKKHTQQKPLIISPICSTDRKKKVCVRRQMSLWVFCGECLINLPFIKGRCLINLPV